LFSGILVAAIWTVIRYRYLTVYSRLPLEPERQEPKMDLLMDVEAEEESKSGISSYLDDVSYQTFLFYISRIFV
jgi:lysophospholipid hydrolase